MVQDPSDPAVQFVVQQGGLIRVIRNGVLQGTNFLNLTSSIATGGERGLLGLAFPGDYARTGRFYVNFTRSGDGATVVARFLRSAGNPLVADPNSRFDLLWPAQPDMATANGCDAFSSSPQRAICQPFSNHNGGKIAFGPDGYLYIGMGDGGNGGDPQNQAQRPATLLGKMLRIDVGVPDADTRGYRIPADNPFVGVSAQAAATLDEIWSFGLRNPWRFTFDPTWLGGTGAMLIGDVGQGLWEEIDYEPARLGGRNYGWRLREGNHDYNAGTTPAFLPLIDAIHEYSDGFGSNNSTSITGGYVYRGTALGAAYRGRYFYADTSPAGLPRSHWAIDPTTREATASDFQDHTAAFNSRRQHQLDRRRRQRRDLRREVRRRDPPAAAGHGRHRRRRHEHRARAPLWPRSQQRRRRQRRGRRSRWGWCGQCRRDRRGHASARLRAVHAATRRRRELGVLRDQRVADDPQQPAGDRRAALPQGHRHDGHLAGDGRAAAPPDDQPGPAGVGEHSSFATIIESDQEWSSSGR